MNETWRQVVPVLISIVILIVIAIVRASSKTLAAIIATMPVTIVLSLWIVYAAEGGDQASVVNYTRSMLFGVGATTIFVLTVWLAARAGWGFVSIIGAGYLAWSVALILGFGLQRVLGFG
jgi:hypothetical protein